MTPFNLSCISPTSSAVQRKHAGVHDDSAVIAPQHEMQLLSLVQEVVDQFIILALLSPSRSYDDIQPWLQLDHRQNCWSG